jgi:hypothetical protein
MQFAHRAFVALPVDFVHMEAAHACVDGAGDREVMQHFLMGNERLLNEV